MNIYGRTQESGSFLKLYVPVIYFCTTITFSEVRLVPRPHNLWVTLYKEASVSGYMQTVIVHPTHRHSVYCYLVCLPLDTHSHTKTRSHIKMKSFIRSFIFPLGTSEIMIKILARWPTRHVLYAKYV